MRAEEKEMGLFLNGKRNEEYLQATIDDIFKHSEADTEVIVGIDDDTTDLKALDEHFRGQKN
jgi:hypothetical protein